MPTIGCSLRRVGAPQTVVDRIAEPGQALEKREQARLAKIRRAVSVEGEPAIAFMVTNVSSKPIRLWPYELPWTHTNSMDLVAMTTDGRVLRMMSPIDDPGPARRLEMAPGHALSGTYPLSFVEKFEEHRKRSDIVVLWSYRLVLEGEEREAGGIGTGVVVFGNR